MQPFLLAAALILIVVLTVLLTVSGIWWSTPIAAEWQGIDALFLITTIVIGIAFVAVNLFIAYTLVRHRYQKERKAFFFTDNPRLEWGLIGITSLGIVLLLAPGLVVYSQVISPPEERLEIEMVAEQWQWHYRYAGEDGVLGRSHIDLVAPGNPFGLDLADPAAEDDILVPRGPLYLPVNQPVNLRMRANDVIHIYFVPEFRVKQAAVPGMLNEMWFTPNRTGEFQAICTEFCGIGHHGMVGTVRVVEQEEFDAWLAEQATAGETLRVER